MKIAILYFCIVVVLAFTVKLILTPNNPSIPTRKTIFNDTAFQKRIDSIIYYKSDSEKKLDSLLYYANKHIAFWDKSHSYTNKYMKTSNKKYKIQASLYQDSALHYSAFVQRIVKQIKKP
jgi:hypothetical protein